MKKTGSEQRKPDKLFLAPELLAVQGLMPISDEDRKRLKDDIEKNGVRDSLKTYIGTDGEYYVLAGATRLDIAKELALPLVPIDVYDAPGPEREAFAIDENLARRHLTLAQKQELAKYFLKASPDKSDRSIGEMAGLDHKTVGKVRKESGGEIPHPEKRTGKDGKKQASTKAKPGSNQTLPKQSERQRLKAEIKATEADIETLKGKLAGKRETLTKLCLLYTSPSPRD